MAELPFLGRANLNSSRRVAFVRPYYGFKNLNRSHKQKRSTQISAYTITILFSKKPRKHIFTFMNRGAWRKLSFIYLFFFWPLEHRHVGTSLYTRLADSSPSPRKFAIRTNPGSEKINAILTRAAHALTSQWPECDSKNGSWLHTIALIKQQFSYIVNTTTTATTKVGKPSFVILNNSNIKRHWEYWNKITLQAK